MYVLHNIEARSSNHCCSGKAESIAYCEYVFLALGIQHAMRLRNVVMWPAPLYNTFPHYLKGHNFRKNHLTQNVCFDFLYKVSPKHFSF